MNEPELVVLHEPCGPICQGHRPPTVEDGNLEAAAASVCDCVADAPCEPCTSEARGVVAAWLGVSE